MATRKHVVKKEAFDRAIDRIEDIRNASKIKHNLNAALMYGLIFGMMASFVANTTYNDIISLLPPYFQIAAKISTIAMLFLVTILLYTKFHKGEKVEKELQSIIELLEAEKSLRTNENRTERRLEKIVKKAEITENKIK